MFKTGTSYGSAPKVMREHRACRPTKIQTCKG